MRRKRNAHPNVGLVDENGRHSGAVIESACSQNQTHGARKLDHRMAPSGLFYVRFMDDILVLSPTRWRFRCRTIYDFRRVI